MRMTDNKRLLSVSEVSRLTGISVRTLRYYDEIGLLPPTAATEAGYRLYDEASLRRLQIILIYRELQFPLREIALLLSGDEENMIAALERQIQLLQKERTHLDNLITLAQGIKALGVNNLDFSEFDVKKIDEYEEQAKASWGTTDAYKEYERKSAGRTPEDNRALVAGMTGIIAELGELRTLQPSDSRVQAAVQKLQDYITEHYYTCTDEILLSLGSMYSGGGSFQHNIDKVAGEGTAEFISRAIGIHCGGGSAQ